MENGSVQGETGSREIWWKDTEASRLRDKKSQIMVVAVETREARDAECLKEVELIWIRQDG